MVLRMLPDSNEGLLRETERLVTFDAAAFRKSPRRKHREEVQVTLDMGGSMASESGRALSSIWRSGFLPTTWRART